VIDILEAGSLNPQTPCRPKFSHSCGERLLSLDKIIPQSSLWVGILQYFQGVAQ
jgi:hypothetical protein